MPNTIVRSFQAPRPIASPSPGTISPSLAPGARGALSTLKFAWGGLAQPASGSPGGGQWAGIMPIQPPPRSISSPIQPPSEPWSPRPGAPGVQQQPGPFKPVPAPFGQPGTNPPMMRGPLGMGRGMNFRQPGVRMAMGGLADFEQVLGNSAGVPQAMQAYGSPLRLAEGGSSWWGPFQHARLAGAAAAAGEQRHRLGAEDALSQAKDFNKIGRAAMTPSEQDMEEGPPVSPGLDFSAMTESAPPYLPKSVSDFGSGALRGAKHWPREAAEFLSLPASIPLSMIRQAHTGMSPEDFDRVHRRDLSDNLRENIQRGAPIAPQYRIDYGKPIPRSPWWVRPPIGQDPFAKAPLTREAEKEYDRLREMSPKERELDAHPSMTAAPSRAENIGQEIASWLNPALIAGPLAELGNWLARPVVKAASASTRRAYRIPRQVPLSRGLGSRSYDYARFGSGAQEAGLPPDVPESIQAGLGVK